MDSVQNKKEREIHQKLEWLLTRSQDEQKIIGENLIHEDGSNK